MANEIGELLLGKEAGNPQVSEIKSILQEDDKTTRSEKAGEFIKSYFGPDWTSYQEVNQALTGLVSEGKYGEQGIQLFDRRNQFVQLLKDTALSSDDTSGLSDAVVLGEQVTGRFLPDAFKGAETSLVLGLTTNNELTGLLDEVRTTIVSFDPELDKEGLKEELSRLGEKADKIKPRVGIYDVADKSAVDDAKVRRIVRKFIGKVTNSL